MLGAVERWMREEVDEVPSPQEGLVLGHLVRGSAAIAPLPLRQESQQDRRNDGSGSSDNREDSPRLSARWDNPSSSPRHPRPVHQRLQRQQMREH